MKTFSVQLRKRRRCAISDIIWSLISVKGMISTKLKKIIVAATPIFLKRSDLLKISSEKCWPVNCRNERNTANTLLQKPHVSGKRYHMRILKNIIFIIFFFFFFLKNITSASNLNKNELRPKNLAENVSKFLVQLQLRTTAKN